MIRLGHIRLLLYNVEVSVWRLRTYKKPVCVWYIPCILLVYPLYTSCLIVAFGDVSVDDAEHGIAYRSVINRG